jgi:hypothetical protein
MWNKKPLTEKLVTSGKPVQTAEKMEKWQKDIKSRKSDQKDIFFLFF